MSRNPQPQAQPLSAVAFGSNAFVAVGFRGTILVSTDGTNWLPGSVATTENFTSVTYGQGIFLAGSDSGKMFVSQTGRTWFPGATLPGPVADVGYNRDTAEFLAVTTDGWVARSSNAVFWITQQIVTPFPSFYAIAGNSNAIVVTSTKQTANRIYALPRGATNWVPVTQNRVYDVIATDDGGFAAVGDFSSYLTSADGTNWQSSSIHGGVFYSLVVQSNFIALGGEAMFWSTNGASWSYFLPVNTDVIRSMTFGNGTYVAVGDLGQILTSTTGTNWISQRKSAFDLNAMVYGTNGYVAVGSNYSILISSNAIDWNVRTSSIASGAWSGVAFGNSRYVAVSADATEQATYSLDGQLWNTAYTGTNTPWLGITYGNGRFIAFGNAIVSVSSNAVDWIPHSAAGTNGVFEWYAGTYGNGLFVVAGGGAASGPSSIGWSSDGSNWTAKVLYELGPQRAVAYGNGIFVSGGAIETLFVSSDGSNWLKQTSPVFWINSLVFVNGRFYLAGAEYPDRGRGVLIYSSSNALTWDLHSNKLYPPAFRSLATDGEHLFAVGARGSILEAVETRFPVLSSTWNPATRQIGLRIAAPRGMTYQLQAASNLTSGPWINLRTSTNEHDSMLIDVQENNATNQFYRIRAP